MEIVTINFELDLPVLRRFLIIFLNKYSTSIRTVSWESSQKFQTAKRKVKISEIKAKKFVVHSLRYLLFAEQIMTTVIS